MKITKAVNLIKKITLVLTSALIYFLIFNLNKILFDTYEFSYGVNWIFIPSGFQLVLVLVAVGEGALGIVLASFIIGLENYYLDSVIRTFITALISGLAPLLSRKICFDFLGIDKELLNISAKAIIQMSLVFAFLSASLHQIWFFYNGKSEAFTQSLFVMAVGNLLGTALVLGTISILTSKFKNKKVL
jgi:hypothetical protein